REDCLAVVHAHPPHAVALTLAGEELLPCMPEAVTALGEVPTARYATPGTERVAEAVRPYLKKADCVLMERHRALAMGFGHRALLDGCDKREMMGGVARVQLLASLSRPPTPLSAEERRTLDAQREANLARVKSPPRPWERDRWSTASTCRTAAAAALRSSSCTVSVRTRAAGTPSSLICGRRGVRSRTTHAGMADPRARRRTPSAG